MVAGAGADIATTGAARGIIRRCALPSLASWSHKLSAPLHTPSRVAVRRDLPVADAINEPSVRVRPSARGYLRHTGAGADLNAHLVEQGVGGF